MKSISPAVAAPTTTSGGSDTAMAALFVLLWATGFIGAKYCLPHAGPFTILGIRFAIAAAVLGIAAVVMKARWPSGWRALFDSALIGLLVIGFYIGGVFLSIAGGLPSGLSALIVGLQPLTTAALSGPILGERVTKRQWLGLVLGLGGVALVVAERMGAGVEHAWAILPSIGSLIGITFGSLYQRRRGPLGSLTATTATQTAICALLYLPLAWIFEGFAADWTLPFTASLLYLTLFLSVAAMPLYYILVRRGGATKAASVMYLVPPVTAVIAFLAFDERLGLMALTGMVLAAGGVALVNRR